MTDKDFWWDKITGPHAVVTEVADALLDNHIVVLAVPSDLPWRHSMRQTIHHLIGTASACRDIVIHEIDAVDDNPKNLDPGKFILSEFARDDIYRGYRSGASVQDYITAKEVIRKRIIWVKGLKGDVAKKWIRFCRGFKKRKLQDGLFVLEIQNGREHSAEEAPLEMIDYTDYVSNYDVQLFNSFVLNDQRNYSEEWKNYIASVVASLCETDAEVSSDLLEGINFTTQSVINKIKDIAQYPQYERRGTENKSNHILWYVRNNQTKELEKRLWRAQLQVLFPIIEMERISLIRKWNENIQKAIDYKPIQQYSQDIENAEDVELGTLCYMMNQRTDDGQRILYIPDDNDRNRILFLHKCRNSLAHVDCCTPEQVVELLDFHQSYI